jgi:glycosyltransferase involved in cell wall biosynthesis
MHDTAQQMDNPRVSVVMAVYNEMRFLDEAVTSILTQTLNDFEFIIIDDYSTDGSWDKLQSYREQDKRIVLVRNEQNIGLTKSLNRGFSLVRGKYIARQDADDISLPERLKIQFDFMQIYLNIGLLATAFYLLNEEGQLIDIVRRPTNAIELRWHTLFYNPFAHTSVMLRSEILKKHQLTYDPAFRYAQDYDLWTRYLKHTSATILDDVLVGHRIHTMSISTQKIHEQEHSVNLVVQRQFQDLAPQATLTLPEIIKLRHWNQIFPKELSESDIYLCIIILNIIYQFNRAQDQPIGTAQQRWMKHIIQTIRLSQLDLKSLMCLLWRSLRADASFASYLLFRRLIRRLF